MTLPVPTSFSARILTEMVINQPLDVFAKHLPKSVKFALLPPLILLKISANLPLATFTLILSVILVLATTVVVLLVLVVKDSPALVSLMLITLVVIPA